MSVLIKGMEMPTNCFLCPLSVLNENRLFREVTKNEVLRAKIDADCPLVPVPKHGRLGDMDAIARKIRRFGDYVDFTKDEIAGWFENGDFETIIPAEEVEK